jgi:G3E family GTPase
MARPRKAPIPITVVAGPRAAGKTTLINRLLEDRAFADTAVILNDFGRTELRGAMVETAEDRFIALGSGCVCCAVRGALTDGLENLLRDLDNGRVAAIRRVIVEADESADPAAVLAAVERIPISPFVSSPMASSPCSMRRPPRRRWSHAPIRSARWLWPT